MTSPACERARGLSRRCPNTDADPSQAVIEAWQNFTDPNAEYRERMGDLAGPAHARVSVEHSCGWSVSFPPGPLSWMYVASAVTEHFGSLDTESAPVVLTDEPGPEVTEFWDREGDRWIRTVHGRWAAPSWTPSWTEPDERARQRVGLPWHVVAAEVAPLTTRRPA